MTEEEKKERRRKLHNERCRRYRESKREELYQRNKEWALNNPEKVKESHKKYRANNKDKTKSSNKLWKVNLRKDPSRLEHFNRQKAKHQRQRKANQRVATVSWHESEKDLINRVYGKALELGFEVDHIVPITSKKVCGLHTWANLQLLSPELNASKRNRHWPDMP